MLQQYSPPYNSPDEDMFAWSFTKHLADDAVLQAQHEIETFAGCFRLDFFVTASGRQIGLECGDDESRNYTYNMFRDSIILGCSSIAAIYRIGGSDIHYAIDDALYTLSTVEPEFFSSRGLLNLKQLATRGASIFDGADVVIHGSTANKPSIWVWALRRDHSNPVWKRLFDYAYANRTLPLDQIIAKSESEGLKWFSD